MTSRQRAGAFGLLAAALLVRVILVLSMRGQPYFDTPVVDSAAYDRWGWEIATKSFWGDRAFYQDPLYPYGLGIFYTIFGRDFLWIRLVQAMIGTLGLWMLFEAARRFLDYPTAMVALAMGAFTKTFLFYDTTLLKEFLGPFFIEAALFFWSLDKKWKWLAAGAALGLGALVRGNLLLVPVAAAALLGVRREWKSAGLVTAGALLCILPVTTRNAAVAKDFVLTTSQFGPNLYIGNNAGNTTGRYQPPPFLEAGAPEFEEPGFRAEAERRLRRPLKPSEIDRYWRGEALGWIGANFGTFLGVTGKRLLMMVSSFEIPDNYDLPFMSRFSAVLRMPLFTFGLFTAPLAAVGIYLSWQERGKFAMLYLFLAATLLPILFIFVFGRYRLPAVPILIVFAAHGVVTFARMMQWQMRAVPRTAAAVFLVTLVAVNLPLPASVGGHRDSRVAHRNLGLYYLGKDQPAEAAREFEAAAKLSPGYLEDPLFVWKQGEAYERSRQTPLALEKFRQAVRLAPGDPEPPYRTGLLYFHEGMNEQAAELLAEALRRDRTFVAAALPLAEAYRRLKRHDDAVEALEDPIRAAPGDGSLRLKRAEIYRELKMEREAREDEAAAERIRKSR